MPKLEDFGFKDYKKDERSVLEFVGGEDAALDRLKNYMQSGCLDDYKETRNELLGADASSKLSPWLSQGSLSVKKVYDAVTAYKIQNASTDHFISELFWRDFFIFYARDKKSSLFYEYGANNGGVHDWRIN